MWLAHSRLLLLGGCGRLDYHPGYARQGRASALSTSRFWADLTLGLHDGAIARPVAGW